MFSRVALFGLLLCAASVQSATIFPTNSTWRFLRGTNEASLPDTTVWRGTNFNDAAFADAPAPFWYGDARPGGTELLGMSNVYTCIFLRKTFVVTNTAQVSGLRLTYFVDDGFVVWINGRELYRENVTDPITRMTSAANQLLDPAPLTNAIVSPVSGFLVAGTNVIAVQVINTSLNSSDLGFDLWLETIVNETIPPVIVDVSPPPNSTVTALTQVTVTFSEPVVGVNADDLLIDTQPASAVSGSGTTYTFTFPQPLYGDVSLTWFASHGITDEATPPNPFDASVSGATWQYTLVDNVAPLVSDLFPPAGATVRSLSQVEVTFSEEVTGVDAADLRVNGQPATSVTRTGVGPYVFLFPTPPSGTVQFQWAAGHGITDQAEAPNAFAGGLWNYQFDPNVLLGNLVINEFLVSNVSTNGLRDPAVTPLDPDPLPWIEILNRGNTPVSLQGWSLSDDEELPGLWVFPAKTMQPGEYLIVFASGLDITNPPGTNRLHTNFKLSQSGEFLGLYTPDSPRVLASGFAPYPEQRNDNSYGYDDAGNQRYFATPTPGAPNGASTVVGVCAPVHFNATRGHFTQPFTLALSTPTVGATIRYTTSGAEPTLSSGFVYSGPLRLTNTTLLRAAAFRSHFLPSRVVTHSYLFNFNAAQRSVPIINIVTATNNLIGRTGILGMGGGSRAGDGLFITNNPATDFHNPSQHGIAWERPVSAEYILPGDNSGFQIDCGIRVQGSDWQRPRTTPTSKFSFRLYFRGAYGPGRLDYPLFPLTTVQNFDQMVLRAGFNEQANPFIRDEITRRLSHDMGQVASHGDMALVLLNGGSYTNNSSLTPVYNTCERVHEEFMQSYLGGGGEWDVVCPNFASSSEGLGVVDGSRNDFNNLLTYVWTTQTSTTITNPAVYNEVARRLDLVNFVDYCLLNAYTAMGDWPANNWRAGRERGTNGIWRFVVWDAEWAMGIYSLAVTRDSFAFSGTGTEDAGLNSTGNSEIARLYQRLRPNREFRLLWADRIHKHFFNGGALTGANITNRFNQLRDQLVGFIPSMDTEILAWARDRRPIIMGQFNTYGLYGYSNALYGVFASSNAPAFNRFGGRVAPGFALTMTAPLGGTIYYTTNGADPRVPFSGAVSNSAAAYSSAILLSQSVTIKARTRLNVTNWSALAEATFEVGRLGVPLRITEIMFNPPGGSIYEFIELQNVGTTALDLTGITLEGVTFNFLQGSTLAAGATLVLIPDTDPGAFAARYPGVFVGGLYGGSLDNNGERLALKDRNGRTIVSVDYNDKNGWPTLADGRGYSLEILDPAGDPDAPANWRASSVTNGTPGVPLSPLPPPLVVLNELMATNRTAVANGNAYPDWIELYNSGASGVDLTDWSLTDDGNDPRRFVFPSGTTIGAGGYLVVWCDDTTNTTPGLHTGFKLEEQGESIFLYNAGTNQIDAISFGLQLPDYSVGRVGGEWQLTVPTTNAPNVAATVASQTNLVINEWMANPVAGQDDWIELYNRAVAPVALRGSYFGTSNELFQLKSLSFAGPGGFVQLHADEQPGPDHLDFKLPALGGAIVLYDDTGAEFNRVTYGAQITGVSQGRLPDGGATITNFVATASPGAGNYVSAYTGPVVNELMARNQSAVTNTDGQVADWVELFNPSGTSFNLSGMSLSVGKAEPGQWTFPATTTIAGNGYLVIWCDGSRAPSTNVQGILNLGRSLDGDSGGVYLFNAGGQLVNFVEYGFQLINQSVGLSGGQWRLLTNGTPGAANAGAATLGSVTALRLNEWAAAESDGNDWFEIYNPTNQPVSLAGLYLTDDPSSAGQRKFQVAPLSYLPAGGWVKFEADDNPGSGRNHVNFNLDEQGEILRIYATNLTLIDSVEFGSQPAGGSEGRLPDGAAALARFLTTPTPGESNYAPPPDVVVNEVLTHTDLPFEDAIELFNPTGAAANIGGWFLSNSQDNLRKYRVPDGTTIPAGGYLVIYENQFNSAGATVPFTLNSAHGDEVWLSQADANGNLTGYRAAAEFGASANGVSFGRHATSLGVELVAQRQRTFGADNPATIAEFRQGTGLPNAEPKVGPVVISEIMYHPPDLIVGGSVVDNTMDEFIELHNTTASPVPLYDPLYPTNTWRLSNAVEFVFPPGVTLAANGYLMLVNFDVTNAADVAAFRANYGVPANVPVFGPYAGKLDNNGESVELYQPDPPQGAGRPDEGFVPYVLADRVKYADTPPWPAGAVDGGGLSLQRRDVTQFGNEPLNWAADAPTAGAVNRGGVVSPPTVTQSPAGQAVPTDTTVVLSVGASGGTPLSYQWRFNGMKLDEGTNATLVLYYLQPEQDGEYDVLVSNAGGSAFSQTARVRVLAPPVIAQAPVSQSVLAGVNVTFTVQVTGPGPMGYQWRFNGVDIPGATGTALTLSNVQLPDAGDYSVAISNPNATITATATLIVRALPIIRLEPLSQTVAVGTDVALTAGAYGTLPLSYRWRRSNLNLTNAIVNSTNSTYTLLNVRTNDAGAYNVAITNLVGPAARLTSNAYVTVVIPPTNKLAEPGTNVTFTVTAFGAAPIRYQWLFNGTNLVAETNTSLTLSNAQPSAGGTYAVVVSVVTNVPVAPASFGALLTVGSPDTDGDGIPDDWEIAHGLNPNDPNDATLDSDGDGLTNWQEYVAGTNPADAGSVLKLAAAVGGGAGANAVALSFEAMPNRGYAVQCRDTLATNAVWTVVTNVPASAGPRTVQVTNALPAGIPQRFYRVVTSGAGN